MSAVYYRVEAHDTASVTSSSFVICSKASKRRTLFHAAHAYLERTLGGTLAETWSVDAINRMEV